MLELGYQFKGVALEVKVVEVQSAGISKYSTNPMKTM